MLNNLSILLVDDHAIVRSSLAMLFEANGAQVVGEAAEAHSAIEQALALRPQIILMDITMPGMDGIEATRQILAAWKEARIIALTMHAEQAYLLEFLEAGGKGYIQKAAADRDVLQAIQAVMEGKLFVGEGGMQTLLSKALSKGANQNGSENEAGQSTPGPQILSERERLVLQLTVRGYTSREIGDQLKISPHTVDTYRGRIMEKLGLEHRHQLVDYALKYRLLS